jgi:hypothetical protein
MLEKMENGRWTPVLLPLNLNSDKAAVLRNLLDAKIKDPDAIYYYQIYISLKRKIDNLPF